MAKPILRLGPVDELDDEYDPLLGRSVRDEPMLVAASSAPPLDPDQSVFDEPAPVAEPVWVDEIAPLAKSPPAVETDQPSLLDWMESAADKQAPDPEPEHVAELEPEVDAEVLPDAPIVDAPVEAVLAEPVAELEVEGGEPDLTAQPDQVLQPAEDFAQETSPRGWNESDPEPDATPAPEPMAPVEAEITDTPPAAPVNGPLNPEPTSTAQRIERATGPSRAAQRRANMKRSPAGRRRAAQKLVATVTGTALFAISLFFTLLSFLAPLGYPFDAVSSYRWYWTLLALAAGLSWALVRGRNMMIASALVGLINLIVVLPSLGTAPKGGQISNAVVAWANVAGDDKALEKVLREAERQKAGLILIAKAPESILTPPQGWKVIEPPNFSDPTSIAVLSRGRWQSSTTPGEPTITRTAAGDLTIIATLPPPSTGGKGVGTARESQLNRAAVRAGDQEGPVAVLGDFGVAPWDGAMSQFRKYGNVTRVRCGGFMGATVTQAFGLIGIAYDHAYVRDVKVTHCRLGGPLNRGGHRAIYLYLAPLDAAK
jgi:endonuclease/exonuclease/phosphatase (EEP) superfamily protein YafD